MPLAFIRNSIRWKLLLTMSSVMIGLVTILTLVQISAQRDVMHEELERRIDLMRENLTERGKTLADNIGRQADEHIASYNFSNLMVVIRTPSTRMRN